MERDAKTNREIYSALLTRERELRVSSNSRQNNVRVIDHAEAPGSPVAVTGRRTWLMALGAGLALAIAVGLGLHNLSEGLAIGESAHIGAIAFTGVLAIGFALHNITEGFGIAAPMTTASKPAPWRFLGLAGLIGGGPTFIGTWIGFLASSSYFSIAFLAVAAGAILYVLNELFNLGRKISTPTTFAWGLLAGFLIAFATDLFLTVAAGA